MYYVYTPDEENATEWSTQQKNRVRDDEEFRQRESLDVWIKRSKEEVPELKDDVGSAKDSSDTESEPHPITLQSPCQDEDSSLEDKERF